MYVVIDKKKKKKKKKLSSFVFVVSVAICASSGSEPSRAWMAHGVVVLAGAAAAALYLRWSRSLRRRVVGIIPARFASSRFEGKPLVRILGKPMIQRTWERAKLASTLDHVDNEKIAECCRGFGADVIMTSESCRNGTERCNEALQKLGKNYDIVVNIQGDEPLIEPEIIDGIVRALQHSCVTSLKHEDAFDPNRVKCVVNNSGYAIYFSRGLIPFNKSGKLNPKFPSYLLHLGIQSYDTKFLKIYPQLPPTPLQLEEDLEQLKVLENGYKMKIVGYPLYLEMNSARNMKQPGFKLGTSDTNHQVLSQLRLATVSSHSKEVIKVEHDAHGVDTPEDVEKIEALMRERNIQ